MSGRLGHWRIAGMPVEAEELFSKRSAEIDEAVAEEGWDSYRARGVAARTTRTVKRHTPVDDLMVRWRTELDGIGLHPVDLIRSVERAAAERPAPGSVLTDDELGRLVERLVAGDGPLAGPQGVLPPGRRGRRRAGRVRAGPRRAGLGRRPPSSPTGRSCRSSAWPAPPSGPTPARRSSPSRRPSPPTSPTGLDRDRLGRRPRPGGRRRHRRARRPNWAGRSRTARPGRCEASAGRAARSTWSSAWPVRARPPPSPASATPTRRPATGSSAPPPPVRPPAPSAGRPASTSPAPWPRSCGAWTTAASPSTPAPSSSSTRPA